MKELCSHNSLLVFSSVNASTTMSKSNPSALNGLLHGAGAEALFKNHPHPEATRNFQTDADKRSTRVQNHISEGTHVNNDTGSSGLSASHRWSDYTLTGSISGRCSAYSWGQDEAELDRAATESVRRKFDRIDAALFEDISTGTQRVDEECREWSGNFPHLEVRGIHLLDSMEDGTEMVAPDPFLSLDAPATEDLESHAHSNELMIIGQSVKPHVLQDLDETSALYEEVVTADGNLEEFFAFDNTSDEVQVSDSHRHSRLKRHHGLPPVTPNACVRDAVLSLAFNNLWTEVVSVLQPLIAVVTENSQGRDSSYSLVDNTLTPTETNLGEGSPQEQPYILRGVRDPPTLTKASGQSGSKFLRLKYTTPGMQSGGLPPSLPQLTNLSGVMQIRSLSLQQRAHSSYVPNVLPINDNSREGTPTPIVSDRPESSAIGLRLTKIATPLPRNSEYQIPPTPVPPMLINNRTISSRMTNRRNINTTMLKPIEKPKTPALVPIDNGIRGFKLGSNVPHSSPPSTPFVRHTQLPPLEGTMGSGGGGLLILSSDRSPTTQVRISGQQKNRVTFNSRIVSAADGSDWHLSKVTSGDLRPSTTNTSLRQHPDGQKSSLGRKVSDNNLHFGQMKVVGYAAGFHGGGGVGDLKDKMSAVIAEDDEVPDDSSTYFTITGKSGIFQSKPRSVSSRTKSRGHIR